jgi:hypothetical protein
VLLFGSSGALGLIVGAFYTTYRSSGAGPSGAALDQLGLGTASSGAAVQVGILHLQVTA